MKKRHKLLSFFSIAILASAALFIFSSFRYLDSDYVLRRTIQKLDGIELCFEKPDPESIYRIVDENEMRRFLEGQCSDPKEFTIDGWGKPFELRVIVEGDSKTFEIRSINKFEQFRDLAIRFVVTKDGLHGGYSLQVNRLWDKKS
jgi:hypothetical protein